MNKKPGKSALSVQKGIEPPSQLNVDAISRLKANKHHALSAKEYFLGIKEGNRTILSKAITLIESSLPKHQELAEEIIGLCLKESAVSSRQSAVGSRQSTVGSRQSAVGSRQSAVGSQQSAVGSRQSAVGSQQSVSSIQHPVSSIRIGITGVPGVGKSSFIEVLGKELTSAGHKLAVLAIDPSSTRTRGSILGDKTRMEELSVDPNAFIRPSPSAGSLGGVARKTRETIILCEAAGFDVIFVETVGVGQSETTVHSMVDFFLLLMLAGAGDELQGIKRGILEMADAVIINKADGDNITRAKIAKTQLSDALHLYPPSDSGWKPAVDMCSCKTKEGIRNVWDIIKQYQAFTMQSGYFHRKRSEQNRQVMFDTIEEALRSNFYSRKEIHHLIKKMEGEIVEQKINPYLAANQLIRKYFGP
jgi:LAO/AO transport system kinase